jgi:tungstate transport system ATP-binding protein
MEIEVFNLTKSYNHKKVLDVLHLIFKEGGIYGIIGPNGSGKSTLLFILALLIPPNSGKLYFKGEELTKVDKHALRRKITLVFQDPFVFNTTVEKNIAYGLKIRKVKRAACQERVKECLKFVGLEGFEKRKAKELSGGELKRVAIARALALEPEVLLLDEPCANVDEENINLLEEVLKGLNKSVKMTIILATHDIAQAYRLSQEVVYLFNGKPSSYQFKRSLQINI